MTQKLEPDVFHKNSVELYEKDVATGFLFVVSKKDYYGNIKSIPPPALPLLGYGELYSTGWDIPTRWAIDANKVCWMDDAHGHPLEKISSQELLCEAEQEVDKNMLRKLLGEKQTVVCSCCGGTGWVKK